VGLVFSTALAPGSALGCVDGISPSESAFVGTFACNQSDVIGVFNDYAITDESWQAAGLQDDCNANLPFAKVVNAVVFIGLGPHLQLGGFHDTIDYLNESRSTRSAYHGDFYLRFVQQGATPSMEADSETGRLLAEDRTNLHCLIFNMPSAAGVSAGFLAERAAVIVHEAWHHWQHAHGMSSEHANGPTGNCTASGAACDFYYYHAPDSRLPDGSLSSQIGKLNVNILDQPPNNYSHTAYQVMVEFSSDMANFANPDLVPFAVRLEAMKVGNVHISQNFIAVVPYTIGTPVPFPKIFERQNP